MNRRDFLKRTASAIAALAAWPMGLEGAKGIKREWHALPLHPILDRKYPFEFESVPGVALPDDVVRGLYGEYFGPDCEFHNEDNVKRVIMRDDDGKIVADGDADNSDYYTWTFTFPPTTAESTDGGYTWTYTWEPTKPGQFYTT